MGPQKFTALNTAEALKKVRLEMGADAMILSTSDTKNGVEIVAITPGDLANLSSAADPTSKVNRARQMDPEVEIAPTFSSNPRLGRAGKPGYPKTS